MKRAIAMLFLACWLAGCKSQTPTVDPFFGRTTVPPPPTGSIPGQSADPYYRSAPGLQPPSLQASAPYGTVPSNLGRTTTNPTSPPSYSGLNWTNPSNTPAGSNSTNPSYAPRYTGPGSSTLVGPSPATAQGGSTYPVQPVPQNNPALGSQPPGYSPQTPSAQPASMPTTPPGSTLPGGNRYTPPGGTFNYRGTSTEAPNSSPASTSPNRVSTPFFAGGNPNRSSIPTADEGPRPVNDTIGNVAGTNPNINSYQNAYNPQAAYNPGSTAGGANNSSAVQSPIVRTLQPQPRDKSSTGGNNFLYPASRQYTAPIPAQTPKNSPQPTWRESSSSDTRLMDDNIQTASGTEEAESSVEEKDAGK